MGQLEFSGWLVVLGVSLLLNLAAGLFLLSAVTERVRRGRELGTPPTFETQLIASHGAVRFGTTARERAITASVGLGVGGASGVGGRHGDQSSGVGACEQG